MPTLTGHTPTLVLTIFIHRLFALVIVILNMVREYSFIIISKVNLIIDQDDVRGLNKICRKIVATKYESLFEASFIVIFLWQQITQIESLGLCPCDLGCIYLMP